MPDTAAVRPRLHLALGTISFMLCFAAWGLISAFAPAFRSELHLTAKATALLVAVPVLLGSLARIPMGIWTDRFGGRAVFTGLFVIVAISAGILPFARTYETLVAFAFLVGMAGSSFSVGVGYVSRWFPPQQQGSALGVYGMGNLGQSIVLFLGPVFAGWIGRDRVFLTVAGLVLAWAVIFFLLAKDAPRLATAPKPGGLGPVLRHPHAWILCAFYFLTFGGFVAFSIYLPALLRDEFRLAPTDAGLRAAGFVVLATFLRPVGGILADKIGGARVLSVVFAGIIPFALLLSWNAMLPFTVGALGCAALLGLGNGAVFKLVPQFFPSNTASVTGLVGAMGGLGGFFPPLILGAFRDSVGVVWPGFILLAATAGIMWIVNWRVLILGQGITEPVAERARAGLIATVTTALLVASIVVGSRNLQNFDPALVVYTFAVIVATWGIAYHYSVWLRKPPTRLFWERGWQLLFQGGVFRNLALLTKTAGTHIIGQTFIHDRSRLRWWMHQCLFWGCVTAVLITFPLVFGWIHFRSAPDDQMQYITYLFGFPAGSFPLHTVIAWALFHGLDFSAVLVLTGIVLALWRRMRDEGAMALQDFGDFLPLILLFAISITGLALTVSTLWMRGALYDFLSVIHAITVIGGLLYLPFGKFFHIFQRPAQLGVKLYQRVGAEDEGAHCTRCGNRFASKMQIEDLRTAVLPALGFDYSIPGPAGHWQALCPACKRRAIAAAQIRTKERPRV